MKKLLKNSIIMTISLFAIVGCKDFLEEEVTGAFPEEEFYQTDNDALQAVTSIYDMTSAHYFTAWTSPYVVKMMLSDESNAGGANEGDQAGYQNLDDFNIDSNNDKVEGAWKLFYFSIFRANKVINLVKPETELRTRLIAEAKVLRAMNYFDLVTLYGDVPLVLTELTDAEYTTIGRASKAAVYDQIETDLLEAIPDLPVKSGYGSADLFRVSKGTAQALLGKAYLYQEEWVDASTQLEAVILSGEYGLENSIGEVFSTPGEFGKESLFELSSTSAENYNWDNFVWGAKPESNIHIQLMGPRSDFYKMAEGDSLIGGWGFNVPKQKLYDAFVAAGDSSRRVENIMSVEELRAKGGDWTVDNAWDFEGFFQRKYGTFKNQTESENGVAELNYGTNMRIIRYADVLLMAAEAAYRNANEVQARQYVNEVRSRPGTNLPDISSTGNDLFIDIVRERQLELAFEGFRFLDLVRWGLASQELGDLGFIAGKHEVLPIPQFEVRSAGLKQNNNY